MSRVKGSLLRSSVLLMLWSTSLMMTMTVAAQTTEPMKHPQTGAPGFWVPEQDLRECLICFDEREILEEESRRLEENTRKSIELRERRIEVLERRLANRWIEWVIGGLTALFAFLAAVT